MEILGILPGHLLQQTAHRAILPARHYQMNVVRHQRVPMHQDSTVVGMLIHQGQKPVPVFVREKHRLPLMPRCVMCSA